LAGRDLAKQGYADAIIILVLFVLAGGNHFGWVQNGSNVVLYGSPRIIEEN